MEEARAVMAEHLELLESMEARRSLWADREGRVLKVLENRRPPIICFDQRAGEALNAKV